MRDVRSTVNSSGYSLVVRTFADAGLTGSELYESIVLIYCIALITISANDSFAGEGCSCSVAGDCNGSRKLVVACLVSEDFVTALDSTLVVILNTILGTSNRSLALYELENVLVSSYLNIVGE